MGQLIGASNWLVKLVVAGSVQKSFNDFLSVRELRKSLGDRAGVYVDIRPFFVKGQVERRACLDLHQIQREYDFEATA